MYVSMCSRRDSHVIPLLYISCCVNICSDVHPWTHNTSHKPLCMCPHSGTDVAQVPAISEYHTFISTLFVPQCSPVGKEPWNVLECFLTSVSRCLKPVCLKDRSKPRASLILEGEKKRKAMFGFDASALPKVQLCSSCWRKDFLNKGRCVCWGSSHH